MKTCTKCSMVKPESEYFFRDKKTGRLHSQCKECYVVSRRASYTKHYSKQREYYLERAKQRNAKLRREYQQKIVIYLSSHCCELCKESDIRVLEFDHIDRSKKKFTISQAVRQGYSWETITEEIEKCRVLCANCHKRRTARQFHWHKDTI